MAKVEVLRKEDRIGSMLYYRNIQKYRGICWQ
nr:MAG TPA: hypothetical protein [Caudoviricetes sp.]